MMQVGIVNNDSFSQQLRAISQRRRQGVFEIATTSTKIDIHFVQGRIIDVVSAGVNPIEEMAQIFQNAGLVSQDLGFGWNRSYRALLDAMLAQPDSISEEVFREALKQRILSKLYALNGEQIVSSNFNSQMIECERELLPSISVGQLLLDLVAIDSDRDKFNAAFPEGKLIAQGSGATGSMSSEERAIFDLLSLPRSLDDLARLSMLSSYPLRDILLRLSERGLIRVEEPKAQAESVFGKDILSQFDTSIDAVFRTQSGMEKVQESSDEDLSIAFDPAPQATILSRPAAEQVDRTNVTEQDSTEQIEESEEVVPRAMRWSILSAQLLNNPLLPKALSLLIFSALIMLPLLLWGLSFEEFAH